MRRDNENCSPTGGRTTGCGKKFRQEICTLKYRRIIPYSVRIIRMFWVLSPHQLSLVEQVRVKQNTPFPKSTSLRQLNNPQTYNFR